MHVLLLHTECIHFEMLFNRSRSELEGQRVGIDALAVLQRAFGESITMAVSRLNDPARTGGHENLSLARLMSDLKGKWPDGNEKEADQQFRNVNPHAPFWKEMRDKFIAHLDFAMNRNVQLLTVTSADVKAIDETLIAIARLMNTIERSFMGGETVFRFHSFDTSAAKLVECLGLPVRHLPPFGTIG